MPPFWAVSNADLYKEKRIGWLLEAKGKIWWID
jgi:hypothetical protein